MKLKHTFEIVELDDGFVGVPVGVGSTVFHGVLKLNESAKEIFELLKEETSVDEICYRLNQKYPGEESSIKEYAEELVAQLQSAHLLE